MRVLLWLARLLGISAPAGARRGRVRGASQASPANENGDGAPLPEVDLSQPSPAHDWGDTAALGEDQGWRFGYVSCQVPTPVAFGGPEVEEAARRLHCASVASRSRTASSVARLKSIAR